MPIEWFIALRLLRESRAQTALILGGVSVGVAVIVFLSSLIDGLQLSIIERTLGSQPHITVFRPDETAREVFPRESGGPAWIARVEKPAQRARGLVEWQRLLRRLQVEPGVVATAAVAAGPALALRGQVTRGIQLIGAAADELDRIIGLRERMRGGTLDLGAGRIVLGLELARDLGVGVGDRVRVETMRGGSQLFLVAGLFELGNKAVDSRWALCSLRAGQALLGLPGGATEVYVRVSEIYAAERIAARIRGATGLSAESWMTTNAQLLTGLRSQSASSALIQVFVVLAVAMGIASVLIVSVVQRARAIGILRAMGMPRVRILRLFLFQGAVYGALGSLLGSAFGIGLVWSFLRFASPLFPIEFSLGRLVLACAIAIVSGVVSAVLPARRAAKLDPAVAIRNV